MGPLQDSDKERENKVQQRERTARGLGDKAVMFHVNFILVWKTTEHNSIPVFHLEIKATR